MWKVWWKRAWPTPPLEALTGAQIWWVEFAAGIQALRCRIQETSNGLDIDALVGNGIIFQPDGRLAELKLCPCLVPPYMMMKSHGQMYKALKKVPVGLGRLDPMLFEGLVGHEVIPFVEQSDGFIDVRVQSMGGGFSVFE